MRTNEVTGLSLILLAAIMNGAYAIPMRFMSRWRWENIWIVRTALSLWVFPLAVAIFAVPHPLQAYSHTSWISLVQMCVLGLLWGSGVLFLGLSFPLVGVAVGAAVGLGCAAAAGTLLPILYTGISKFQRNEGALVLLGVIIVLIGVGICGLAGRTRERRQGTGTIVPGQSMRGFLFASLGGTLTAALNLALAAGSTIAATVQQQHPTAEAASIAVWLPVLLTGGIPGLWFTLSELIKHRSTGLFRQESISIYWLLVAVMGILWLGSILFYGNGVTRIGALGSIVGWPIFMSGAVIASAAWGTLFGEWKGSGRMARAEMAAGVLCLIAAIVILGNAGL